MPPVKPKRTLSKARARRVPVLKRVGIAKKAARTKPVRKLFDDSSLFGALPGMGKWAFPLLKELRDE